MLVISLLSEALEYQRCCNDRTICEQFMSLIVRTCIHCKLSWQLFYVCWQFSFFHIEYFYLLSYISFCLQCFNAVGWVAGRASGLVGWGPGKVICLERDAHLHMAHLMPLSLASVKSRLVLPFWYVLTRVVLDKGPLNGCVCVVCLISSLSRVSRLYGMYLCTSMTASALFCLSQCSLVSLSSPCVFPKYCWN